jgi:hypothetical protein
MKAKEVSQFLRTTDQRRETGLSLMVIGSMLWFFDLLVFFFVPAAIRLERERPFVMLIAAAFLAGAVLMASGAYLRRE